MRQAIAQDFPEIVLPPVADFPAMPAPRDPTPPA
jgi:hypothetical protein